MVNFYHMLNVLANIPYLVILEAYLSWSSSNELSQVK